MRTKNKYTQEQVDFLLQRLGKMTYDEVGRQFHEQYGFTPSISYRHSLARKHGIRRTKNTGNFRKGHKPWNKGTKGVMTGGVQTQFKKGRVPHNEVPMWSERINRDGIVEIKVPIKNPHSKTDYIGHFVSKSRWVWQQKYGDIPEGHVIVHLDGNSLNNDLDNLECITRSTLARLNHQHSPDKSSDADINKARVRLAQLRDMV